MNEKLILSILDKFSESEAAELTLSDGALRLSLRKESAVRANAVRANAMRVSTGQAAGSIPESLPPSGTPPAAPAAVSGAAPTPPVHLGLAAGAAEDTVISPIVAVFYASPGPGDPPFVKPGSRVKKGDTLCILEAMKMMNRLEAEFDCEILSVLAASGDGVEYGQPLFAVKRI
jgi:acetyl-CoA carboxylase biotin carboxyl carrier protein